jgi:hypothetical protein
MDDQTPAEILPTLYRDVLETVARLSERASASTRGDPAQGVDRLPAHWDAHGRALRLNRDARATLASKHRRGGGDGAGTEPA